MLVNYNGLSACPYIKWSKVSIIISLFNNKTNIYHLHIFVCLKQIQFIGPNICLLHWF